MPNYVHSKCLKHISKNMYCTPYKDLFTGINCSRNIISLPHYHYSSLLSSTVILFSNFSHACPYAICICISIISVAELQHYLPIYYILYLLLVLRIYFLLSAFSILLYCICICIIFAGASSLLASVLGGGAATPPAGSEETIEGEINRRRVI